MFLDLLLLFIPALTALLTLLFKDKKENPSDSTSRINILSLVGYFLIALTIISFIASVLNYFDSKEDEKRKIQTESLRHQNAMLNLEKIIDDQEKEKLSASVRHQNEMLNLKKIIDDQEKEKLLDSISFLLQQRKADKIINSQTSQIEKQAILENYLREKLTEQDRLNRLSVFPIDSIKLSLNFTINIRIFNSGYIDFPSYGLRYYDSKETIELINKYKVIRSDLESFRTFLEFDGNKLEFEFKEALDDRLIRGNEQKFFPRNEPHSFIYSQVLDSTIKLFISIRNVKPSAVSVLNTVSFDDICKDTVNLNLQTKNIAFPSYADFNIDSLTVGSNRKNVYSNNFLKYVNSSRTTYLTQEGGPYEASYFNKMYRAKFNCD